MRSGYMTWHDAKKVQLVPVFGIDDKRIAYWSLVIDDVTVGSIFGTPGCGFPMAIIERVNGSREIVDQNEAEGSPAGWTPHSWDFPMASNRHCTRCGMDDNQAMMHGGQADSCLGKPASMLFGDFAPLEGDEEEDDSYYGKHSLGIFRGRP